MAIVQTISTASQFKQAFIQHGREDQFSVDALEALFDYYDSMDDNVELDVIAICCDWSELTWQDCAMSYGIDLDHCIDDDERAGDVLEYMLKHTTATELPNGNILFINF